MPEEIEETQELQETTNEVSTPEELEAITAQLEEDYDPNLQTATRAQERADAILRTAAQEAQGSQIVVPTNCGQELLDIITVTDERCGISEENYRVQAIQTDYDRRQRIYTQRLALCAP